MTQGNASLPRGSQNHPETPTKRRWLAVFEAFFVTILWSSSFIIIKFGLQEIPPLIFAGLRYALASIVLLGATLMIPIQRKAAKSLSRKWWGRLVVYGVIYYAVTMGTQFLGLALLEAITVSFVLNFTTILVVVLAFFFLHEKPNKKQLFLVGVALFGGFLYFYPVDLPVTAIFGIFIVVVSLFANAFSAILGRSVNRPQQVPPLVVTTISMTIGAVILLVWGLVVDGVPMLTPFGILIVVWLSVINTALTFTLWNRAMQHLQAVEITIINSTMMGQIAIMALVFLGEMPTLIDWVGIVLVMITALLIQLVRKPANQEYKAESEESS